MTLLAFSISIHKLLASYRPYSYILVKIDFLMRHSKKNLVAHRKFHLEQQLDYKEETFSCHKSYSLVNIVYACTKASDVTW